MNYVFTSSTLYSYFIKLIKQEADDFEAFVLFVSWYVEGKNEISPDEFIYILINK